MLRLMPIHNERFVQANHFQANYGGGEANVAVSLSHFGNDAWFVTVLPNNDLGQAARNQLRAYGVHTDYIQFDGDRLGIYFLEQGASLRSSKVIYDRTNSSISKVKPGFFVWDKILKDKKWFHITGITPAVSAGCSQITLDAVKTAKGMGLTVSCDLNYRNKLWSRDEARQVMSEIVQFTDLIIANEEDCSDVFGIESNSTDVYNGNLDESHYRSVASQMMEISKAKYVAITLRESLSASDNNWSAVLFDGAEFYTSRKYSIHLVDRVGGGDSFGAGLIHCLVNGKKLQESLEFAVAASALKQTIPGDMNLVSVDEVMEIVKGNTSGRVQR